MKRTEMISEKTAFYNSREFTKRKITKEGNDFLDKKTGIVFAKIVYSLNNIPYMPTPCIFLSSRSAVLDVLTEPFRYTKDTWTVERIQNMPAEEFDYIWLRQCSLLERKPSVDFVRAR